MQAVLSLAPERRYDHFIKRVADHQELWALRYSDEQWAIGTSEDAREFSPVWPDERYAALMASGQWDGAAPHAIVLDEWMRKWLPGLTKDGRLVAVFPRSSADMTLRTPEALAADLRSHLLEWYGEDGDDA